MNKAKEIFRYPEEIKAAFLASGGLTFENKQVSAEEIWRFMTVDGPTRFPASFTIDPNLGGFSPDVDFFAGIKHNYYRLTEFDRLRNRYQRGKKIVVVQDGPTELLQACGCVAARPPFHWMWAMRDVEGLSLEEAERRNSALRNECKKCMPAECCSIVAPFHTVRTSKAPVDFLAPVSYMACSDAVFTIETTRSDDNPVPSFIMDFPVHDHSGSWRVEYLAAQFRLLARKLGAITSIKVTDEALNTVIVRQNRLRRLARECTKLWWDAPTPPLNSSDRFVLGLRCWEQEDETAVIELLTEARAEVARRVTDRIKGAGIVDDPVRILVCGSCAHLNAHMVEQAGGVIVGNEEWLNNMTMHIDETGDPFINLASAACAMPYEQPPEKRAAWIAQLAQMSRADGVIFIYNWGCNYQSAMARVLMDIVKTKTGLPTTWLDIIQSGRQTSGEQLRTRVEAFIEIMQRHRAAKKIK